MLQKLIHFFPLFLIPPPPVGEKTKKGYLKTANTNSGRVNNHLALLSDPKTHPWVPSDRLSPVLQPSSSSPPFAFA